MYRYFMELAYRGTTFHGWQLQPNAISVQQVLNENLSKVLRQNINVVGAGRTDAGVHASHFVAHFDVEQPIIQPEQFCHKIDRMCGDEIVVFGIYPMPAEAHARFDASSRKYLYFLHHRSNPFRNDQSWHYPLPLDYEAMNCAANRLFNHTDFTSFSRLHTQVKTNNCTIMEARWEVHGHRAVFHIKADRFLRNMVRAVVGTLVEVGRGKLSADDFEAIIVAKDRSAAGTSAPPQGLFLHEIVYPYSFGIGPQEL